MSLDASRETALEHAAQLVLKAWRSFDRPKTGHPLLGEHIGRLLSEELPKDAVSVHEALDDAARVLDVSVAQARRQSFAFLGSSGLEIGVLAELLARTYEIVAEADGQTATAIEEQAIRWVGQFVGYSAAHGVFTNGGSSSNALALATATQRVLPESRRNGLAGQRVAIYCSAEAHSLLSPSVELLGIGSDSLREIPVDALRRMRSEALAEAIDRDLAGGVIPLAVVATAGTTLTGAIDPISGISDVCTERRVWLHVDGSYGLPASTDPAVAPWFANIDRSDSVSVDAHKWLYLPHFCGILLFREAKAPSDASIRGEHEPLQAEQIAGASSSPGDPSPFLALGVWLAFRTHGSIQFGDAIARNLEQARLLYRVAQKRADFEVLDAPPQLSIVPFRHAPAGISDVNAHNEALAKAIQTDGRIYLESARIDDDVWLRACFMNFRTTTDDVLELLEVARELGESLIAGITERR
jgi:aromatic-L-amino-acid decarboxylase